MRSKTERKKENMEDVWINTTCGACYCGCGARVRKLNGVPVKIEGIQKSTMGGEGSGLCGKGAASLMYYHDPNRIKKPLRRTNADKGIGVDPKWKEISWDEALDEIAEKINIQIPALAQGRYELKFDIVNENKFWFEDLGSLPYSVFVDIVEDPT